jgi:hypothetical protein
LLFLSYAIGSDIISRQVSELLGLVPQEPVVQQLAGLQQQAVLQVYRALLVRRV